MHNLILLLLLLAGTAPHVTKIPSCARRLGEMWREARAPVDRTLDVTKRPGRDVVALSLEDGARRLKERDPSLFQKRYTVTMTPFGQGAETYGPFNYLRAEEFDSELQNTIAGLLAESRAEARLWPAVAAQMREIRSSRAAALWRYRADPVEVGKFIFPATLEYWRDQRNVEPQARRMYANGLEVGAWVFTMASGRREIMPFFSGNSAKSHCELEVSRPLADFVARLAPGDTIRSAALFHNHPDGSPMLSSMDFKSTDQLLGLFPEIGEFHIYAIAQTAGGVELGHYGVRR